MRKKIFIVLVIVVLVIGGYLAFYKNSNPPVPMPAKNFSASSLTASAGNFNKNLYSLTDPTSIWVIVNKQHPLNPKDYAPPDLVVPDVPLGLPGNETMQLRKATALAMEQMFTAAKSQDINLMLLSGYRSYAYQVDLFNYYAQKYGEAAADRMSAHAGYSEHQTGFAADVGPASKNCELQACFADTPEGNWLAINSYKYGFIIRYSAEDESITGYEAEPWHIRYVGTELSTQLHASGIKTLEQFFNVGGGTVYK